MPFGVRDAHLAPGLQVDDSDTAVDRLEPVDEAVDDGVAHLLRHLHLRGHLARDPAHVVRVQREHARGAPALPGADPPLRERERVEPRVERRREFLGRAVGMLRRDLVDQRAEALLDPFRPPPPGALQGPPERAGPGQFHPRG